jgi:hypothetical protein
LVYCGSGAAEGIAEGIPGGIAGGIPGGIADGIPGGIADGIAGGIPGGIADGIPGGNAAGIAGSPTGACQRGRGAGRAGPLAPAAPVLVSIWSYWARWPGSVKQRLAALISSNRRAHCAARSPGRKLRTRLKARSAAAAIRPASVSPGVRPSNW